MQCPSSVTSMNAVRIFQRVLVIILIACIAQAPVPSCRAVSFQAPQESAIPGVAHIERNVVFGMYSGLALLMDVYRPEKPNGYGAVLILGSAWAAPLDYGARPLKNEAQELSSFVVPLTKAGYTVFAIDHRAAPRFHYPAMIDDAHRAVRYIRHYAKQFGINPSRIAAVGYSSGAHLASLLGLMDGAGDDASRDPVERESGRVQCVVAGGTPADLKLYADIPQAVSMLSAFLGEQASGSPAANTAMLKRLEEASPVHFVKAGDPPFLLFHGDADQVVPYSAAQELDEALAKAHVPVKLITIQGGTHDSVVMLQSDEFTGEMVAWLDKYLKSPATKK
jgi:acetyl esterase/lipase